MPESSTKQRGELRLAPEKSDDLSDPRDQDESDDGIRAALYQKAPFIVRFGSVMVFLMLMTFIVAASELSFANSVHIPVRIVAGTPPVDVNLPPGTRVTRMLVRDGEKVTAGQPLALLSTPDVSTVFTLPLSGGALPNGLSLPLTNSIPLPSAPQPSEVPMHGASSPLRAPATGEISFVTPPEEMTWRPGAPPPLVIVTHVHTTPRAYASIPLNVRGKMKPPERIRIELAGYPKGQNGWLEGTVTRIAVVSQDNTYLGTIKLDQDLRTTRGVSVPVEGQAVGLGEIDAGGRRLIDIILSGMKSRVSPGR